MLRRALYVAGLVVVLVYTLFPFYWAVNGSLQPSARLFAIPADYLPWPPTLDSYRDVLENAVFLKSLRNSVIVAASVTLLALICGSLAAYALGRLRMRGGRVALGMILAMTMFPQIAVLGAVHSIITWLGLYNTLAGLVLSYMLFTLPLTVWVLAGFFRALPRELEESAYVDGAGPLQTFWYVMLPLAAPGMAATGLLAFIAAWNEYLFALSLTITDDARTVPVVIANLSGATLHETPWGAIMAGCVIVTVPLVILVMVFQRRIVEGLTAGAVKG
jgi:trehalose/maltose transport system permease protein